MYMKRNLTLAFILIGLMMASATYRATRPDAGLLKFRVQDGVAYGYGVTKSRSLSDFKRFIDDNPQVHTLVLMKMPGTQDGETNTKIARLIRQRGLNTHLRTNSVIASGAVDLFIAGQNRTMACGALIGVHSWSIGNSDGLVQGKRFHPGNLGGDRYQASHEKFLKDMGVDPAFYVFTREAALPEDIYYLSPDEIEQYGLLTEPNNCN